MNRRNAMELLALGTLSGATGFAAVVGPKAAAQDDQIPVTLETPFWTFRLWQATGRYELLDKQTRVTWSSNPYQQRFGEVALRVNGKVSPADLSHCEARHIDDGLEITFRPRAAQGAGTAEGHAGLELTVSANPVRDEKGLELSYRASHPSVVESVTLLDDAFWTTDAEDGSIAVPARMGLLIPATSRRKFSKDFGSYSYEGCHMEWVGSVKSGATAMITWNDPYTTPRVKSQLPESGELAGKQVLSLSLQLRKSAHSLQVMFPGKGDYMAIAKAYRPLAAQRGFQVPWTQKIDAVPERKKLLGAINFKLWACLDRRMNAASTEQEFLEVDWTFDEAAQVAEHLKSDLKLDRVLFILGGWTHRGYDNEHPDVMPPAPECGGGAALADCSRRVQELGYVFGLHDNYQDIYRDSPSWSESLVMKHLDGSLVKGGVWWGGQAYLICSHDSIQLAERPQNLPAVKELTHADAYFFDTTFAAGLQECYDPHHPLQKPDDMHCKQELSDYGRSEFGIFGSEDGREWAVAHADFFEGLTGVSGRYFHNEKLLPETGGFSIPLFETVFRDTIALYGKYGFDIMKSAEYVLYHISIGRTLNYHAVPHHLYWKGPNAEAEARRVQGSAPLHGQDVFTRGDNGWSEGLHPFDRFVKNTYEILSPLHELTAKAQLTGHEFLSRNRKVQHTTFVGGSGKTEVVVNGGADAFQWKSNAGGEITLPQNGFLIESAALVAFHALKWNGLLYSAESAPLFTLRSMDGKPLDNSANVRVYHGFGDESLSFRGKTRKIKKEGSLT
ncbi:MAG TPA: DUF5696 domain-containing protein [Terriglobia bacterium]|nr:DUF5696 domain-containing protein [Terriglobia bacterium]